MDEPLLDGPADAGTSLWGQRRELLATTAHISKAILGIGVTAIPTAFWLVGALPGTLLFLAVAALTHLSGRFLYDGAAAAGQASYSGVAAFHLGRGAAIALDVALVSNCFGMLVVQLIMLADLLGAGVAADASTGGPAAWLANRTLVLTALTLLLVPLVSFRHLKQLTAVSKLGVAAIGLWTACTLGLAGVALARGTAHGVNLWPCIDCFHTRTSRQLLLGVMGVVPVVLTAYICQFSYLNIVHEAPSLGRRGVLHALALALAACFALFMGLALASETVFGSALEPNVLRNFNVASLTELLAGSQTLAVGVAASVRSFFFVCVLASYPLHMAPLRTSLAWLARPSESYRTLQARVPAGWKFFAETYGLLLLAFFFAAAVPSIWVPMQLIGATAGALIAFVLPGCLGMALAGPGQRWSVAWAGGALLVVLGMAQGVAGVLSVLASLHSLKAAS